jgi:hypothetical protein
MNERGELFLGSGVLLLAVAGGLCQFVLIGLLGVLLFPVGWALLLIGGASAGNRDGAARHARGGGVLFFVGSLVLVYAAAHGSSLAYSVAIHRIHRGTSEFLATGSDWLVLVGQCTVAATLIAAGLRRHTGWSARHLGAWAVAVALVGPLAAGLFFLLAAWLAFTA